MSVTKRRKTEDKNNVLGKKKSDVLGIPINYQVNVESPNVIHDKHHIYSTYLHQENILKKIEDKKVHMTPMQQKITFRTQKKVPRAGVMLVGIGGNNGTTVVGGVLANKHSLEWNTKDGLKKSNYFGSLTQATTVRIGVSEDGNDVHAPFSSLLPMVHPNDLVLGGWDISKMNLVDATKRAGVFDYGLQEKLKPYLKKMDPPIPSIYYPDFIASNQEDRADNTLQGSSKQTHLDIIRKNIRDFKQKNNLDFVCILWTANTERFCDVTMGIHDNADNLLKAIRNSHPEISQSCIFATAAILEGCPYLNGSPQNTLIPGVIDLAERNNVYIAGDDFKSGQTKIKSVLADFLVSSGLRIDSIVSYNHLGNNDGKNLSEQKQFRSKEISKAGVVEDMVEANHILFEDGKRKPDHVVVIKYVPSVGDSKRAMDEYVSSIFMNGSNQIVLHNTCEDSLLAAPIILDLIILTELMTRIQYKKTDDERNDYGNFRSVLSILSFLLKAPVVPKGTPVVNALMKQHRCITNILSVVAGLHPDGDMLLQHKIEK